MTVKQQSGASRIPTVRPLSRCATAPQNSLMAASSSTASLEAEQTSRRTSLVILSLLAACAFLFVLCACLVFALVLVGKNLSAQTPATMAALLSSSSYRNRQVMLDAATGEQDNNNSSSSDSSSNSSRSSIPKAPKSIDHFNRPSLFDEDQGTADRAEEPTGFNRSTIFLPNSVFNASVTSDTDLMGTVLKMGITKTIADRLSFRLPRYLRPRHYKLLLQPDLQRETFSGRVEIDLSVSEPTDLIVLHSHKLTISDTGLGQVLPSSVGEKTTLPVAVKQAYEYEPLQYWVIETERDIPRGDYRLSMNFTGSLANRIVGFYSSNYLDRARNVSRKIATSKFEPTFARQAFPCFDEPQLKANYTIRLIHPNVDGYHALSNMNEKATVTDEPAVGLSTTEFYESVPMSTYLVVFIVSDFKFQEDRIQNKGTELPLRVFATPMQVANVKFARETAVKVLEYYIQYFDIEYPLPKLDMAAIPDFVSGAMETWGLITYRETSILYDAATSSSANKQRVAEVVAHELAHSWFGNLVTMKWWDELWLNEGFASYIEYKGVHAAYPDWGIMEQFALDNLHGVLRLDATLGSHPIVVKVETPNQITEIFDTITYSKGASVIRMLEDFVSEPIFRQGVTAYLNKLKYQNGVSKDLMEELDKLFKDPIGVTVERVMDTFTKQKGFPVITVEKRAAANQYRLTQKRFLADPEAKEMEESPFGYKWYVPLTYTTSGEREIIQRKWFPDSSTDVFIDAPSGGQDWIKLNHKQVGYYRVNYDPDTWALFASELERSVDAFNIGDRTGLLNDAFALADASLLGYDKALEMTKYLKSEMEYVPWATVSSKMGSILDLLYEFDSYSSLQTYILELVREAYNKVTFDVSEANHMQNRLRPTILDLACKVGHVDCLEAARDRFRKWLDLNEEVHPDVRTVVYYYGMQTSNSRNDWETVKAKYKSTSDANERAKLMSALTAFPDERVLQNLLEEAWDESFVRQQDHLSCIQSVAANHRYGKRVAWDHVRQNWERLVERFTLGERNLGRMIPSVTGRFASTVRLQELDDFFKRYPDAGAGAAARVQARENIENNIKWLARNEKIIASWLKT